MSGVIVGRGSVAVEETPIRPLSSVRRLSTTLWLGLVVLISAVVRFALAAKVPGPGVFPDELIYSDLARSVGGSGAFRVRDVPFSAWTYGPVYVFMIVPAFRSVALPDAYLVAKALNCVAMSLAAVPTYFLARRVLEPRMARLAAVLAVIVPGMAFSSRIMTESLFYPAFLVVALVMVRTLEKPTASRQIGAVIAIGIACLVRAEALVLVPALLTSISVQAALDRHQVRRDLDVERPWVTYRVTGVALLACAALIVGASALASWSSIATASTRLGYIAGHLSLLALPRWLVYHVAELDLSLGIIPFAAAIFFVVKAVTAARAERGVQAFAVVASSTTLWMILLASAFATQADVNRVQERYIFYVEPLILIGFLAWVVSSDHVERFAAVVVGAAVVLPLVLPFGSLLNYHALASSPGLVIWLYLDVVSGNVPAVAIVATFAVGACVLFIRSKKRRSLVAPTIAYLAISGLLVSAAFTAVSERSLAAGIGQGERSWVDRAVGSDAQVVALWSGRGTPWMRFRRIWENEFFNRSVTSVYYLHAPLAYGLPQARLRLRKRTLVLPNGQPLRARYVLSDGPEIAGTPISAKPGLHLTLYRVTDVVRLAPQRRRTRLTLSEIIDPTPGSAKRG